VKGDEGPPGEGGRCDGAEGGHGLLAPVVVAHGGDPGCTGQLAVGLEHPPDRLAVPHLLEDPAGEEGGDLRILVGRGQEEIAQVAHRVVLDVVHVAQRAQGLGREGFVSEVVEVDTGQIQPARPCFVGIDGGPHSAYYSDTRLRPDSGNFTHPDQPSAPNRIYTCQRSEKSATLSWSRQLPDTAK
jgi:hypothetical protein